MVFHMNLKEIFESSDDPYEQISYTKLGLTQRERELFESADFDYTGGKLLKRQDRESDLPEYLRIDNIMTRTKMNRNQALLYRKYLTRISPNLYRTFEGWMKKRGIEPGLKYFRWLSMNLREVETPSSDYLENRTHGRIYGSSSSTESFTPDYWHPINENYEMPWLIKQSGWVMDFVVSPKRYSNLKQLRGFGKLCYEAARTERPVPLQKRYLALNHDQQSVFWTHYNIQKEKLESQIKLGPTARRIIKRMEVAPLSRLPYIGAMLYKMQHGERPLMDPPNEDEWRKIWETYREKKGASD